MRIFLDQNLSPKTKEFLKSFGFDVIGTRDVKMTEANDKEIMEFAIKEKRIIITFNGDFGDIHKFPLEKEYPGVIRLKVYPQTTEILHPILADFFSQVTEEKIKNNLIIIDNYKFRIKNK